jgi:hypothetical protein
MARLLRWVAAWLIARRERREHAARMAALRDLERRLRKAAGDG